MFKKIISLVAGFGLLSVVTVSSAVPFNSFDPKSMAMGGAGVAVPNPANAPFFNPALLSIADADDDFVLELPILGGGLNDPNDLVDALDNFNDTLVDDLDREINNYNGTPGDSGEVLDAINRLNSEILTLDNKPAQFEINGGLVVGIPSEKFGVAFSVAAGANFAGTFNYEDSATVTNLTADLATLDNCYAQPAGAAQNNCIQTAVFNFDVDTNPASPTFGDINFNASDSNNNSDIMSSARFIGITYIELGLSLSREFYAFGNNWAVGLTPKSVDISVIDYTANADRVDSDSFDADNYTTDYSDFNIDVGIARDFDNGWRGGLVVKNIISYDYKAYFTDPMTGVRTETGTVVSLKPQIRVGVSHSNDWSTVTADLDITKNEPLGNLNESLGSVNDKSQFLALGVELNAFDTAQLRFGYKANFVNSDRNILSAGFGLSPFGVHIDMAVAGNDDEVAASFQLGFRF